MATDTDRVQDGRHLMNGSQLTCFSAQCAQPIAGRPVWLGETYDGHERAFSFHPECADGAWPLFERPDWPEIERTGEQPA